MDRERLLKRCSEMVRFALGVLREDLFGGGQAEWPLEEDDEGRMAARLADHAEASSSQPDTTRPLGEVWRDDVRLRIVSVITDEPLETADLVPPDILMRRGRPGSVRVRIEVRNTLNEEDLEDLFEEDVD